MTPAKVSEDGLDIRRYCSLSPLEQLERLEADGLWLNAEERARRAAEAELKAKRLTHQNAVRGAT